MIRKLRDKWQVSYGRLVLILVTFAIGGSLTGIIGRELMEFIGIDTWWQYYPVYILMMTIIWPAMVLIISIPLGQFQFFTQYLKKLFGRLKRNKKLATNTSLLNLPDFQYPRKIAIFASGAGSNAQRIINHFRDSEKVQVACILYNKINAGVKNIAEKENIPLVFLEKDAFFHTTRYIDQLKQMEIQLIVLAGFLWKIPDLFIKMFPGAIINIHPALLPDYGGKGMYGNRVHEAVIANKEPFSGITIHFVDEHYDNGDIIFQAKCPVLENDTADSLAQRIHLLEHANYPIIIESLLNQTRL